MGSEEASSAWGRPAARVAIPVARALRKAMSRQEAKLWLRPRALRLQELHFRRQVPIDRFVVDFACLRERLVVEVDGGGHGREDAQRRDAARDERLAQLGYQVIRFWNAEVDENPDAVMDTILARIEEARLERSPR